MLRELELVTYPRKLDMMPSHALKTIQAQWVSRLCRAVRDRGALVAAGDRLIELTDGADLLLLGGEETEALGAHRRGHGGRRRLLPSFASGQKKGRCCRSQAPALPEFPRHGADCAAGVGAEANTQIFHLRSSLSLSGFSF